MGAPMMWGFMGRANDNPRPEALTCALGLGMALMVLLSLAGSGVSYTPIETSSSVRPWATNELSVTFSYSASGICYLDSGQASFVSAVSGGTSPYNLTWNFGDGSPVKYGVNTTHTYADPFGGPYVVTLTVKDSTGATASDAQQIVFVHPSCPPIHTEIQPVVTPLDLIVMAGITASVAIAYFVAIRKRRHP